MFLYDMISGASHEYIVEVDSFISRPATAIAVELTINENICFCKPTSVKQNVSHFISFTLFFIV